MKNLLNDSAGLPGTIQLARDAARIAQGFAAAIFGLKVDL
jgi:hypothetical protein